MPLNPKSLENLKPPKKGEVRNPNGRPKGAQSIKTVLRKWLEAEQEIQHPFTKEKVSLTQLDIITLEQLKKARKGDTHAYKTLLDRLFGKPKQTIDIDHTTDGEPITQDDRPRVDLSKLSTKELKELLKLQKKMRG